MRQLSALSFKLALLIAFACILVNAGLPERRVKRDNKDTIPTVKETFIISEDDIWIDCTTKRKSVLINGMFPGPTLSFETGTRVILQVQNNMVDKNFTLHSHGLSMAASAFADGTPLSQWPIAPKHSFIYEYFLSTDTSGTFYVHGHLGLQLTTAFAALIVKPGKLCSENQPKDRIMLISDIWAASDEELSLGLLADPFKWTGNSKTLLLNGMATNNHDSSSCTTDIPVIRVTYGQTYRLRWVGAGSLMYITAGIEGHKLTVIEADGTNLKPMPLDHIEFAPGQRYSTLLTTKTEEEIKADEGHGRYLIQLASRWRMPRLQQFAMLEYVDAKELTDDDVLARGHFFDSSKDKRLTEAMKTFVLPDEVFGWKQTDFEALKVVPLPDNPEKDVIVLDMQQIKYGTKGTALRWAMNQEVYQEDQCLGTEPYLVNLYHNPARIPKPNGGKGSLWDSEAKAFVLEPGQVVDIIFVNMPGPTGKVEVHPMHLHGVPFHVLAQGTGSPDVQKLLNTKYEKGYWRDTLNVFPGPGATISAETLKPDERGGWAQIRYVASPLDTGAFPLHCHISPHLVMGMASVFIVGPSKLPGLIKTFKKSGYFDFGKNIEADESWTPETPKYFFTPAIMAEIEAQHQSDLDGNGCSAW